MNIRLILTLLSVTSFIVGKAQVGDTSSIHDLKLNEVVISASKFKEQKKNVAQHIETITQKEIEWSMPNTSATMLEQSGNIFVQRSQAGGGSPILRGFEASRVLLIIDGVRMNNAIYRSGHLQNVITLDNNMLERAEVLFGPASTLYGSDALGGVMVFNSKKPLLAYDSTVNIHTNFMTRYSSANNAGGGHVDFNIGFKKLASITSVTYNKFGDTRMGNIANPYYKKFGERTTYIVRDQGQDRIVLNSDPNKQVNTGYTQVDLMQKFLYKPSNNTTHTLNLQYSTSSDVPRYDRLTDVRNGSLRFAEWYYGPQERAMVSYQISKEQLKGFFEEMIAGVNYQHIQESRHQRLYNNDLRQNRTEQLNVWGYNIDLRKIIKAHELTIGTDGQYNHVRSNAYSENINSLQRSPLDTRYPDGGSNMYYGAIYAQHLFKIIPNKLILNDGLRLNYVSLNADFNDTSTLSLPFNTAKQNNTALSGNIGLVYLPKPRWRMSINGATGFRSPNIDDLGKVFDSRAGEILIVPNTDLQPEYTYNIDLGISYSDDKAFKIEAGVYNTWFRNVVVLDSFTLNGRSNIVYNGLPTQIYANQNKAKAFLYGFNAAITIKPHRKVTLYSTINYTYGRYFDELDNEQPLAHVPPVFGKTSILYKHKRLSTEMFAMYNGWKGLSDYSPSGEDNIRYATPQGMPAWYTFNIRTGFKTGQNTMLQVALENIFDQNYRVFASGVSAPGRNLVITLRAKL